MPVRSTRQFRQIDAGSNHTCAVTTGYRGFCWGGNNVGQLGDGTLTQRRWPKAVAGGLSFGRVTAGGSHTCGEVTGNKAYCWGGNGDGGLGDGTMANRRRPVAVVGGLYFKQLSAGLHNRTCGKTEAGVGYCWGDNEFYALGNGGFDEFDALTPTPVAGPL